MVCLLLSTLLSTFSTPNMFKKEQFQNFQFVTKTMGKKTMDQNPFGKFRFFSPLTNRHFHRLEWLFLPNRL